jgi:hypothetical protein
MGAEGEITADAILEGRLRVRQPLRGHRVGHDAIFLPQRRHTRRSGAADLGSA